MLLTRDQLKRKQELEEIQAIIARSPELQYLIEVLDIDKDFITLSKL